MTDRTLALNPAVDGFGARDPSAVLFVDGALAAGVEEGRLARRKHAPGTFPRRAVAACLDRADLSLGDVDRVAVPWRPGGSRHRAEFRDGDKDPVDLAPVRERLAAFGPVPPVEAYNHHRSHAASAFRPSGFDRALVVTVDGRGAHDATVVWEGTGDGLRRVATYDPPNSLGHLYAATAGYLGHGAFGGEGKVMGLAAYGEADAAVARRLRGAIDPGVDYDVTGLVGGGVPSGVSRLASLLDRPRGRAATPRVALNCKLNRAVAASPAVDRLFVQPVASDAGAPVGAGLLATGGRLDPATVYWGPSFGDERIVRLLDRRGVGYERPADLAGRVADLLADGAVVGWFQGRLEMGPRALGNRSILADPRSERTRDRVNAFVKRREAWRPLAPSLPAAAAEDYLRPATPAPYMVRAVDVPPERRRTIPAAVHPADGTARPQTVTEAQNPRYHRLLRAFEARTGVPALVNTSFNDRGDPIAATPEAALETFRATGIDALALGGCLITS
ncbi:carbamoyltransferase [Halobacteriales archaeon QS_5_70_17]|nr:MAG: carbamoyltransferase [Halobacteriales archaeon QS_5_70_17]